MKCGRFLIGIYSEKVVSNITNKLQGVIFRIQLLNRVKDSHPARPSGRLLINTISSGSTNYMIG